MDTLPTFFSSTGNCQYIDKHDNRCRRQPTMWNTDRSFFRIWCFWGVEGRLFDTCGNFAKDELTSCNIYRRQLLSTLSWDNPKFGEDGCQSTLHSQGRSSTIDLSRVMFRSCWTTKFRLESSGGKEAFQKRRKKWHILPYYWTVETHRTAFLWQLRAVGWMGRRGPMYSQTE